MRRSHCSYLKAAKEDAARPRWGRLCIRGEGCGFKSSLKRNENEEEEQTGLKSDVLVPSLSDKEPQVKSINKDTHFFVLHSR